MKIRMEWNNVIIAESENFKIVESRYYFPPYSVQKQYLKKNGDQHISRWKGIADCYDIVVDNKINKDAARVYSQPEEGLEEIEGYFSFRDKVEIVKKKTSAVATNLPAGRQGFGEIKPASAKGFGETKPASPEKSLHSLGARADSSGKAKKTENEEDL